jgi:integrase
VSSAAAPSFGEIAQQVIAEAQARTKNNKVSFQWSLHLGSAYCAPLLSRPVNDIKTTDLFAVLGPVFRDKPETGRKLHRAIRSVFDHARVVLRDKHGLELGQNPADWRDLKAIGLSAPEKLRRGRHASLPYPQAPAFFAELQAMHTVSSLGLMLLILTNLRTSSLLKAEWSEIDWDNKVWVVPRDHLKDGKHRAEAFRVPLTVASTAKDAGKSSRIIPASAFG